MSRKVIFKDSFYVKTTLVIQDQDIVRWHWQYVCLRAAVRHITPDTVRIPKIRTEGKTGTG